MAEQEKEILDKMAVIVGKLEVKMDSLSEKVIVLASNQEKLAEKIDQIKSDDDIERGRNQVRRWYNEKIWIPLTLFIITTFLGFWLNYQLNIQSMQIMKTISSKINP